MTETPGNYRLTTSDGQTRAFRNTPLDSIRALAWTLARHHDETRIEHFGKDGWKRVFSTNRIPSADQIKDTHP